MKFKIHSSFFMLMTIVTLIFNESLAQDKFEGFIVPRTNSRAVIQQTIASTLVEIQYNRPNKKGREIFGHLVPFDEVWRTGADEATEIYFSTPISLSGNHIDSGRYELFAIPGENVWEIILQESQNQWGSYRYNSENDVIRFSVTPQQVNHSIETFTFNIDKVGSDFATLQLAWDRTIVPIDLEVDLRSTVVPNLEKALHEGERPPYFQAAMFYFENNIDINRAEELMSLALKQNPNHIGMLYRYALILKEKGDILGAIKASEASLKGAQDVGRELKSEYIRLNTILLNQLNTLNMENKSFTTSLYTSKPPSTVFQAINNVRGWWSEEIVGESENVNDEFIYRYKDIHYCKMKLVEVIPNQKVVWHVTDAYLSFIKDKTEWVDTKVIFEISEKDNNTELKLTHFGLVLQYECYNVCKDAWQEYIQKSLHNLIETGKGNPNLKED